MLSRYAYNRSLFDISITGSNCDEKARLPNQAWFLSSPRKKEMAALCLRTVCQGLGLVRPGLFGEFLFFSCTYSEVPSLLLSL